MTPRQHKEYAAAEKESRKINKEEKSKLWHFPLSDEDAELYQVLESMEDFKLAPEDVPLIIRMTENPKYKTARFLGGAVSLFTHDCIHVLLGRGLLLKDEAFVIGYTMGSTKRMKRWRRNLFMLICKHLYPEGYKFGEQERYVFYSGVMAGSRCATDLTQVNFGDLANFRVQNIREKLGVDKEVLNCYYCIEKRLFPDSEESQRLI